MNRTQRESKKLMEMAIILIVGLILWDIIDIISANLSDVAEKKRAERLAEAPIIMSTLVDGESVEVEKNIINALKYNAKIAGLPQELVLSVAYTSSRFDPDATKINPGGESCNMGIMGLSSQYLDYYIEKYWDNPDTSFNPYSYNDNITVGVKILADIYRKCDGNIYDTLSSYSLGYNNYIQNPNYNPFADTGVEYINLLHKEKSDRQLAKLNS
jgi:soluble lytic murein transglycosylase-like protein